MPENENSQENNESTEINETFSTVSDNSLDSQLLNDILNELKVINENESYILLELQKNNPDRGSVSSNDLKAIAKGVNDILAETVSANTVEYDSIITKDFSEYSLTESFLLIVVVLLLLTLVFNFLKGKNIF